MPRTHAPILAALMGVGLVLVVTRSPGAEMRPASEAEWVAEPAPRVNDEVEPARPADGVVPVSELAKVPPRTDERPESAAIAVEAPEVLARFVTPTDRMALAADTHALLRDKIAFAASAVAAPSAGRPTLVALVASWCAPCATELPRLVEFTRTEDVRLVLVSLDDVAGPESLTAVVEDLFARAEPTSRGVPKLELRADPEGVWTDATAPLLIDRGDPGALPQSLLFTGAGRLAVLVQGGFDDAIATRLAQHLEGLRVDATCADAKAGAP